MLLILKPSKQIQRLFSLNGNELWIKKKNRTDDDDDDDDDYSVF